MDVVSTDAVGVDWGEKRKSRRGYVALDAVDPRDGRIWQVLLAEKKFAEQAGRPWAAKTLAYTDPEILAAPKAIFSGLREDALQAVSDDGWLAYVGRPEIRYFGAGQTGLDNEGRCPQDRVFVVNVTQDRVVFNWRYERVDADGSGFPDGWAQGRYKYRVL